MLLTAVCAAGFSSDDIYGYAVACMYALCYRLYLFAFAYKLFFTFFHRGQKAALAALSFIALYRRRNASVWYFALVLLKTYCFHESLAFCTHWRALRAARWFSCVAFAACGRHLPGGFPA